MYRYPIPITLVLLLLGVVLAAWRFGTIKSTGVPLGLAARTPDAIVQIILTQERYLPSIRRNPAKDRYRLDLLIVSLNDPSRQTMVSLARGQGLSAAQPMTRILGADGDVVWLQAPAILGVNLRTRRVIRFEDLRQANPALAVFLPTARWTFTNQLVAVSPEWREAYAFSGQTLSAGACSPPARAGGLPTSEADAVNNSLCSGGAVGSSWFGALTPGDVAGSFKKGLSLPSQFSVNSRDEPRYLYQARVDASEGRPRVMSMDRLSERSYRSAAMLRAGPGGEMLLLENPESGLMLHRATAELFAPWMLMRVGSNGKAIWNVETGIGKMKQILPDPKRLVLIGERPPVPNHVPEPVLVLVDLKTGKTNAVSLWR